MPPNTVKVDRATKWGNPFKVGRHPTYGWCVQGRGEFVLATSQDDALRRCLVMYREHVLRHWREQLPELRDMNLACWCELGKQCHADVLLELANAEGGGDA